MSGLTHAVLVVAAARWLSTTRGCSLVLTEFVSCCRETPDAIGWRIAEGWSVLVECKTSRADFRRDAEKISRTHREHSIGQERWYLTPPGLLKPAEIPEGWGLLEAGARVRVILPCPAGPEIGKRYARGPIDFRVQANELPLLLSLYRRKYCPKCMRSIDFAAEAETVAAQQTIREAMA